MSLRYFLQSMSHSLPSSSHPIFAEAQAISRLYSSFEGPRQRNWRVTGYSPPVSLVQEGETVDLSENEIPRRRTKRAPQYETPEEWRQHRLTIKEAFPEGWSPPRKISREAMEGLRQLHAYDKETFSTSVLAAKFMISPEAVRRILRSKWEPSREQRVKLADRERRTREERVRHNRLEEKKQKLDMLLAAAKDKVDKGPVAQPRSNQSIRGINSRDKLYFD
ncbi:hypothetical protein BJ138DRAFT_1160527 [Hygrophoropsis aurantiaca]|uniref:Uncharacterized protein n=1 Tax=Hygrophoropsis aurantiaca TaxID=72124 RepID=A0ACB8A2S8_9AGAM|nr:hypothetical protein BJ138DRAFT_1160527 [Hygrophoropsis aurantiaca]